MTDASQLQTELKEKFPNILFNEPLKSYCTFKVGGPADYLLRATSTEDIKAAIKWAKNHQIPFFFIGGGSNILFDDKGFRGLIIRIETSEISIKGEEVTAAAGVTIPKLIETSIQNELSGLEKWVGLPGTVGGAVRGNAGCNGLESKDILISAQLLDPETGEISTVDNNFFNYTYRESKIKHSNKIVLQATFKLPKNLTGEEQKQVMQDIRRFRLTKQPPGFSSGSFFKNPSPEKPAGMLIDQAGLKGKTLGNAQISNLHGNFFLNLQGKASATDIIELARFARKTVKEKFGIELQEEVQILSETGKISLTP